MRLIDADAIPELFDKEYKATKLLIEQGEEHLDNLAEGFTEAHSVIQKMPTIEAELVTHGHWILGTGENALQKGYRMCSQCGEIVKYAYTLYGEHNFCNYCGSKMDDE